MVRSARLCNSTWWILEEATWGDAVAMRNEEIEDGGTFVCLVRYCGYIQRTLTAIDDSTNNLAGIHDIKQTAGLELNCIYVTP